MIMRCWKCGKEHSVVGHERVKFRAVCEKCDSYLHSCEGCSFYKIGLPNDCRVPNTEPVRDRESFNYCEEFLPLQKEKENGADLNDIANKLFGDIDAKKSKDKKDPGDKFNSLFGE